MLVFLVTGHGNSGIIYTWKNGGKKRVKPVKNEDEKMNIGKLLWRMLSLAIAAAVGLTVPLSALAAAPPEPEQYTAEYGDTAAHKDAEILKTWIDLGCLLGNGQGRYRPDDEITLAEMAALVNRLQGYVCPEEGEPAPADIPEEAWYRGDIQAALAVGYLPKTEEGRLEPLRPVTREEVYWIAARVCGLNMNAGGSLAAKISDAGSLSDWARAGVLATLSNGLIPVADGKLRPQDRMTRAEAIVFLDRIRTGLRQFTFSGEFGSARGTIEARRVDILADGVTLRNATVRGDMFISASVKEGSVTLRDVKVEGTLYVSGGGSDTVTLHGCTIKNLVADKALSQVHILLTFGTRVTQVTAKGLQTFLELTVFSEVDTLVARALTLVKGAENIRVAEVYAAGCKFDARPKIVRLGPGLTVLINGRTETQKTLDSVPYMIAGVPSALVCPAGASEAEVFARLNRLLSQGRFQMTDRPEVYVALPEGSGNWSRRGGAFSSADGAALQYTYTYPNGSPSAPNADWSKSLTTHTVDVTFEAPYLAALAFTKLKQPFRLPLAQGETSSYAFAVSAVDQFGSAIAPRAPKLVVEEPSECPGYVTVDGLTLRVEGSSALAALQGGRLELTLTAVDGAARSEPARVILSDEPVIPTSLAWESFSVERPSAASDSRVPLSDYLDVLDQFEMPMISPPAVSYEVLYGPEGVTVINGDELLLPAGTPSGSITLRAFCAAIADEGKRDARIGVFIVSRPVVASIEITRYPAELDVPALGKSFSWPSAVSVSCWNQYGESMTGVSVTFAAAYGDPAIADVSVNASGTLTLAQREGAAAQDGAAVTLTASAGGVTSAPVTVTLHRTPSAPWAIVFDPAPSNYLSAGRDVTLSAHVIGQYGDIYPDMEVRLALDAPSSSGVTLVGDTLFVPLSAKEKSNVRVTASCDGVPSVTLAFTVMGPEVLPVDKKSVRFTEKNGTVYVSWANPADPKIRGFRVAGTNFLIGESFFDIEISYVIDIPIAPGERTEVSLTQLLAAQEDVVAPGTYHLMITSVPHDAEDEAEQYEWSEPITFIRALIVNTGGAALPVSGITHEERDGRHVYTAGLSAGAVFEPGVEYTISWYDNREDEVRYHSFIGDGNAAHEFIPPEAIGAGVPVYVQSASGYMQGATAVLTVSQRGKGNPVTAAAVLFAKEEELLAPDGLLPGEEEPEPDGTPPEESGD